MSIHSKCSAMLPLLEKEKYTTHTAINYDYTPTSKCVGFQPPFTYSYVAFSAKPPCCLLSSMILPSLGWKQRRDRKARQDKTPD